MGRFADNHGKALNLKIRYTFTLEYGMNYGFNKPVYDVIQ